MLKSIIAKFQAEKKCALVASYDLSKMFDKQDLLFCLEKLYTSNVRGKIYRLLYEMNKNVAVKVKTPVGMTTTKNIGPATGQGSVEASVISSNGIGKEVSETFEEDEDNIVYEDIVVSNQCFMDDILKVGESLQSIQKANVLMEDMMGRSGLELNLEKTSFIIMGNNQKRKKIQKQIDRSPVTI